MRGKGEMKKCFYVGRADWEVEDDDAWGVGLGCEGKGKEDSICPTLIHACTANI